MFNSELLLTIGAYSACAAIFYALYRLFRRQGTDRFPAFLAAGALALGLLMFIPGLLHTIAVVGSAVKNDKPYDLRLAWLITTGVILVHFGVSNITLSRWIKRGDRWAVGASAGVTVLLLGFFAALNPVTSQASLLVVYGGYLIGLLTYLATSDRRVASTSAV